ncbi:phage tail protein [Methylobacter sp.]|uniref:phage tail protein n=1 Tax=Methylobacter sp. TaxID=2051955 RepID=UPI002489AB19|nr:phage tail protein [Methylobacter sp.]MDI1279275.1 phage tail protein [Methylobacter sp.]
MIKQPLVVSGTNIAELSAGDYLAGMLGELRAYSGIDTPHGWLNCMGQTLAISDYPELFGVIGWHFGGDGVSDFCLPNYRSTGQSRRIIYTGRYPQVIKSMCIPATIHGPLPGSYNAGDVLSFTVQLLEDTAVTGGPIRLIVNIGDTAHTLALSSSTARDWVFTSYTVQSGDKGDITATINLNGAALSSAGVKHQ